MISRQCTICGAIFALRRPDSTSQTCSKKCQYAKAGAATKALRSSDPEREAARKAKAAAGVRRWAAENADEVSARSRKTMLARMADPEFRRKNAETLAVVRAAAREKAATKRKRVCVVCGVGFTASSARAVGLCSRKCQDRHTAQARTGVKDTEETKMRKAASSRAWRITHPEWEDRRREAAFMATQTEEYKAGALQRYEQMMATGTGICSTETRALTANAAKWVMKKARAAMEVETDFVEVWARVQDRLRREMPYDGPLGTADYFEYSRKLGKALTADPEIRELQDGFMSEAIPRFYAEWKAALDPAR